MSVNNTSIKKAINNLREMNYNGKIEIWKYKGEDILWEGYDYEDPFDELLDCIIVSSWIDNIEDSLILEI